MTTITGALQSWQDASAILPFITLMVLFRFANVCVSGIKVITLGSLSRRVRFITAVAIGLGLGVTIVPGWATNRAAQFWFDCMQLALAAYYLSDIIWLGALQQ